MATRTSGGHHRIARSDLAKYVGSGQADRHVDKAYQYCWEFHSDSGTVNEDCLKCIVYRSRSGRCFELAKISSKVGHSRLHCTKTCSECEYYKEMTDRRPSVLVVTPQLDVHRQFGPLYSGGVYKILFVENEYRCCLEIERFRPDFVVIDCSLGAGRCNSLTRCLSEDKRLPFVRLILVGEPGQFHSECDRATFALVHSPFGVDVLTELITSL